MAGYRHPDHIMCHKISVAAFDAAADPDAYPDLGEALAAAQALLLVYRSIASGQFALDRAMVAAGMESPYTERLVQWPGGCPASGADHDTIACADYFHIRDHALLAHATQIDPDGPWFAVPLEVHKSAWPTEEWELARSLVDTSLPEDDLFAGVAEPAASKVSA
jgi:mycothiol S-conjugate amidase